MKINRILITGWILGLLIGFSCVNVMAAEQEFDRQEQARYEYDKQGRVIKVVYADGSSVAYEYDANGNLLKIVPVGENNTVTDDLQERLKGLSEKSNGLRSGEMAEGVETGGAGTGNNPAEEELFEVKIKRESQLRRGFSFWKELIGLLQKIFSISR